MRLSVGCQWLTPNPSYSDDMILYLKDPKNSTQKLLDIINSYSKVVRI
jgi:hypothetical protein